jgi:hypothetical protein
MFSRTKAWREVGTERILSTILFLHRKRKQVVADEGDLEFREVFFLFLIMRILSH